MDNQQPSFNMKKVHRLVKPILEHIGIHSK
nr:MAG TPA: hypothetical protein [Caudoviricetes sp.]